MNKFIASTLAMVITATAGSLRAQEPAVMLPSDNHAIYRIDNSSSLLMLPVEEREENAAIRVLDGNQQLVKTLNVRLAVDKVDYFVPLKMENGASVLDILFSGNRRNSGSIKGYVCWKEIHAANTFDDTNTESYRPAIHHTPRYGWMNDPNGMFYKDGVYHLYFQYNPYGSQWENMTWGHSTSTDLIHWQAHHAAIEPDALGSIFSGSCVVDHNNTAGFGKDAVVAFYTSAGINQVQCMAVSLDNGMTFEKYGNNPILTAPIPDFRDPKVIYCEETGKWVLVMASGQEMRFYSSPDLKNWTYESSFGSTYGCHDGVWECPDLMCLPVRGSDTKRWVLLCNINPGGPFGGSATQYFVGNFDGHHFTCDDAPQVTKWMDYGKDHYATVTFSNALNGRHIALAWMSNWQYANQVPTLQFRSANSLPRDLDLYRGDDGNLWMGVVPSPEVLAARGKVVKNIAQAGDAYELVIDVDKPLATIVLENDNKESVVLTYDAINRIFSFDRTNAGKSDFSEAFATVTTAPLHSPLKQLRVFVDRCSFEVFDSEGRLAMTNLVFPSSPYSAIKTRGVKRVTIHTLN